MLARGSNGFVCKVRGKEINITANLIGHILDMSTEGDAPIVLGEREVTLKHILGRDNVNPIENILASQLSAELHLRHNIIGRILFSKIGRFDFISK